jgi:plastocyanin
MEVAMRTFASLALAAGLFLPTPALAQPAAETVSVWSFGFSPKPIQLQAGRPVTLTFVNRSGGGHDFTAPAFFANARVIAGAAPDGRIKLPGHASRSITLVPLAGSYPAHCSHLMHQPMGMSDVILVR